jgi:hypothetical protein
MRPGTNVREGYGKHWVGGMNRIGMGAILASLAGVMVLPAATAGAQSASSGVQVAQAAPQEVTAPRRRPQARLRVTPYQQEGVYPHYNPGPNAVRVCNATYVQEYRPSGTVIVPHMNCYWRR